MALGRNCSVRFARGRDMPTPRITARTNRCRKCEQYTLIIKKDGDVVWLECTNQQCRARELPPIPLKVRAVCAKENEAVAQERPRSKPAGDCDNRS